MGRPAGARSGWVVGSRLADLVFDPTLACGGVRRPADALAPSPVRTRRPGQGLHLNRTMLSDQRSPYVGRFACDWHRLPGGCPPGNHRPRREPAASIASGEWRRDGPGRREHGDVAGARFPQGAGARPRRRARGEHIVDQDHSGRAPPHRAERAGHRRPALLAPPPGLRRQVERPLQERDDADGRRGTHRLREGPGLVEASLGQAPARQRHPRDRVRFGRRWPHRHHRATERGRHRTPSGELQPVHGMTSRAMEQERGPGQVDLRRRTLRASGPRAAPRNAAALAPRRGKGDQLGAASGAERPGPGATPRAAVGEQDVEQPPEHGTNLARATDITGSSRDGPRTPDRPTAAGCRGFPARRGMDPSPRCEGSSEPGARGRPPPCPARSSRRSRTRERGVARRRRTAVP